MAKHLSPNELAQVRRFIIETRREDRRLRPNGPRATEPLMYEEFRRSFPHLDDKITFDRFRYHNRRLQEDARAHGLDVADLELPDDSLLESSAPALVRIEHAKQALITIIEEKRALARRQEEIQQRLQAAQDELRAAREAYSGELDGFLSDLGGVVEFADTGDVRKRA
jgi:hypothetical protein